MPNTVKREALLKLSLGYGRRLQPSADGLRLFLSVVFVAAQMGIALVLSKKASWGERYLNLSNWDSKHYAHIAQYGYQSFIPLISPIAFGEQGSNVAFFPAYPYLGRILSQVFGWSEEISLLVVSQVFAVVFWYLLMERLYRSRVPLPVQGLGLLLIWLHPASFYLVTAYSESLFLAALLLFLRFSDRFFRRQDLRSQLLASFAGFGLVGTRIVGISFIVYPICQQSFRPYLRCLPLIQASVITAMSGSALLVFFAYCQLRFGCWDLYFRSQRVGWNLEADYGALWKWADYSYFQPWDHWAMSGTFLAFLIFIGLEGALFVFGISRRAFFRRLPLYTLTSAVTAMTVFGLFQRHFSSVIRYSLPWYVLFVLCLCQILRQILRRKPSFKPYLYGAVFVILMGSAFFFLEVTLLGLNLYLSSNWFA